MFKKIIPISLGLLFTTGNLIATTKNLPKIDSHINCLTTAYPTYISAVLFNPKTALFYFKMKNGETLLWDDNRPHRRAEELNSPTLKDVLVQPYPAYRNIKILPQHNEDPGRYRNEAFFRAIYGETERAVQKNLVLVTWLPNTFKKSVHLAFNSQNGAAAALQKVSNELDRLPAATKKYLVGAGTINFRNIAGTPRISAHSLGIAIDINTQYSHYWRNSNKNDIHSKHLIYENLIPKEIVTIFEKNHFIWGGRWYHYDTMHFEYRPEFFVRDCKR